MLMTESWATEESHAHGHNVTVLQGNYVQSMQAYNDWTCKVCLHVHELVYACQLGLPANAMLVCRTQAEHFCLRCEGLLSRMNYQ